MGSDNNWLCPPVCLIVRVIRHIELCRAQRTLVLPLWNSAIFLNVCARDGVHWNSFVVDWVYFPGFICLSSKGYFFQRRPVIFGSRPLNFGVIGLRVNFRRPRPPSSLARFCSTPIVARSITMERRLLTFVMDMNMQIPLKLTGRQISP